MFRNVSPSSAARCLSFSNLNDRKLDEFVWPVCTLPYQTLRFQQLDGDEDYFWDLSDVIREHIPDFLVFRQPIRWIYTPPRHVVDPSHDTSDYEWDMLDVLGVHFPSLQALAFQTVVRSVSPARVSPQATRVSPHPKPLSDNLRIATLKRSFSRDTTLPSSSDQGNATPRRTCRQGAARSSFRSRCTAKCRSLSSSVVLDNSSGTLLGNTASTPHPADLSSVPNSPQSKACDFSASISLAKTPLQKSRSSPDNPRNSPTVAVSPNGVSSSSQESCVNDLYFSSPVARKLRSRKSSVKRSPHNLPFQDTVQDIRLKTPTKRPVILQYCKNKSPYKLYFERGDAPELHATLTAKCGICAMIENQRRRFQSVKEEFATKPD